MPQTPQLKVKHGYDLYPTVTYGMWFHIHALNSDNYVSKRDLTGRAGWWIPAPSTLQWRHNGRDGISNHQPHDCLLKCLFRRRLKKHQSSAPLSFVRGIHRSPVNSPHKWPVTRKMFPYDDVIMISPQSTAANRSLFHRSETVVILKKFSPLAALKFVKHIMAHNG